MPNREAGTQVKSFQDIYKYLIDRNFTPLLHVMENEYSRTVKNFIIDNNKTRIQFLEANEHQINATKRAIQRVKNHLITGLCTVHKLFSMQL